MLLLAELVLVGLTLAAPATVGVNSARSPFPRAAAEGFFGPAQSAGPRSNPAATDTISGTVTALALVSPTETRLTLKGPAKSFSIAFILDGQTTVSGALALAVQATIRYRRADGVNRAIEIQVQPPQDVSATTESAPAPGGRIQALPAKQPRGPLSGSQAAISQPQSSSPFVSSEHTEWAVGRTVDPRIRQDDRAYRSRKGYEVNDQGESPKDVDKCTPHEQRLQRNEHEDTGATFYHATGRVMGWSPSVLAVAQSAEKGEKIVRFFLGSATRVEHEVSLGTRVEVLYQVSGGTRQALVVRLAPKSH